MKSLSPKEFEVLTYLTIGLKNDEIARILFVTDDTIKVHITSIMRKFDVKTRTQAAFYAIKNKIVNIDELELYDADKINLKKND